MDEYTCSLKSRIWVEEVGLIVIVRVLVLKPSAVIVTEYVPGRRIRKYFPVISSDHISKGRSSIVIFAFIGFPRESFVRKEILSTFDVSSKTHMSFFNV